MGIVFDMLSGNLLPLLVESTMMHPPFSKVSYVKIEARGIEGPVVTVTISGLEIAGGLERRRVPQAAP